MILGLDAVHLGEDLVVEFRIAVEIEVPGDPALRYEVVFHSGEHFGAPEGVIMSSVVLHIHMPDASRRYHIPMILAPHSYSTWWSA